MMKLKYSAKLISSVIAIALILSLTASVIITTQDDSQVASEGSCPSGCECMSDAAAEEQGLELCNGESTQCLLSSGLAAPEYGHCYQTAEEPAECPNDCVCLSQEDGKASGYELCNGVETECVMPTGATGKCYEVTCPEGCACVTEAVATTEGYQGLCDGKQTLCGYDDSDVPQYCYIEPADFGEEDIDLSQIRLPSGEIRFTANTSYPVGKIEMMIGGIEVKECSGGYCEYTGGPYTSQEVPAFSAVFYDEYNNPLTMADYLPDEITTTIEDFPQLGDFEPCPYCPEPEEGWGECTGEACSGADFADVYDPWSWVQLDSCNYVNHSLTATQINLGEGMSATLQITDPIVDYCINGTHIALHWCRNGVRIVEYIYECPYGCDSGRCICSDTDGGIDLYEYGGVRDGASSVLSTATDYCLNDETLREYYTETDYDNNTCTIKYMDCECPGVCENGACHGTCDDGIQNEGELGIDCGGPCFNACEYDNGWYAQNYGFKFSNPAGTELSYGDCWSGSRHCSTGYGNYKDTFGNCEVCICNPVFRCCSGWHVHAGSYYLIYRYAGASAGQCTGMSLSSLRFYYGDQASQDYDSSADEVTDLEHTGTLKNNIAARQGKVVSGENIDHYLFHPSYWGANDVLNKVENALDNDPPDYGMIFMIEDNGWGGWQNTVRQTSWAHTVVATYVEQISSDITRIYIYDPNVPMAENPTADSPYVNVNNSPYIDINTQSNSYTYIDDPNDPTLDSEGEWISNSNDELFDRIGYMQYSKLGDDVDIPWEWDLLLIGILGALGSADAQVEDGDGATLGFSEDGSSIATIEDGMILPAYGDPGAEFPTVFALPMGDY
ncbi:MAG: hypothetical protein U9N44_06695, partial [Chloroflexota bacterium]|nr:hypothetical protein [Chloroflexota bacterium]